MKGSPGGILLIGAGVFLLTLGWTGRFAAVWEALSGSADSGKTPDDSDDAGNEPPSDNPPSDDANGLPICRPGERRLKIENNGEIGCHKESFIAGQEGGTCRPGYLVVYEIIDDPNDTSRPACLNQQIGGGNASFDILPTGKYGLRIHPNV